MIKMIKNKLNNRNEIVAKQIEEYFDIYASRPGTSSVDYSTFIKPDFEEEEATTIKSYQKNIATLLELYDDSMFEELMQYIEGTYYEHPEDREE